MDVSQLMALARDLLLLISPLVAQGALAKIGENTSDATQGALVRAWGALQRRFAGDADAEADLRRYAQNPSQGRQEVIVEHVAARFTEPAALAELSALVAELRRAQGKGTDGDQIAQIIGDNATVGTAIARDLHGNLTIASLDQSRNKRVEPAAMPPVVAVPPAAPTPRRRVDDATLSADGVHFSYGHALIVGISKYADRAFLVNGNTTANDAGALAELLRDAGRAAYPPDQVRVLTDTQATRAGILAALDELAQRVAATPESTALIFFAGHGVQTGAGYALLSADAQHGKYAETAIPAELFQAHVAKIRQHARRLVVILNCCHAGGVGGGVLDPNGASETGDAPPPEFYRPLATGSGQVVISSSRPDQKSGARSSVDATHTNFGAQLLDALKGAAPGQGPGIGVFELFSYLRLHVPTDAAEIIYKGAPLVQEPLFYASQLDDNLAVALRPAGSGTTLGGDVAALVRQLAELELRIEPFAADPPAALLAERDALLTRIAAAS